MANISLYRRWRSQVFDEIVGQKHITRTLQNVLKNRKLLSHAYLFCGPRGTGKTSMARIFAKALNCTGNIDNPPCNECNSCKKITKGMSMDVMEIDAASHTSVEMVREYIIDKVNFAPMEGSYKVYIIDEVHKLSNSSFNALLKTLEEPPSHVVFILATTHPYELLPTILSRCQRFDFKRISQNEIITHLREICHAEGYNATESALGLIASVSSGALRDALVILEQAFSFSDGEISASHITSLLGISEQELLFSFSQLIAEGNVKEILMSVDLMVKDGKDIFQFVKDLIEHYRYILISKVIDEPFSIIETTQENILNFKKASELYTVSDLLRVTKILSELAYSLKDSFCERPLLEMSLIKAADKNLDVSLSSLKQRIDVLEKNIKQSVKISENKSGQEVSQITQERVAQEHGEDPVVYSEQLSFSQTWARVLQAIKSEKIAIHALLIDTKPVLKSDSEIMIGIKEGFDFHKTKIDSSLDFISEVILRVTNKKVKISTFFMGQKELKADNKSGNEAKLSEIHRDFVREAEDIFGSKI